MKSSVSVCSPEQKCIFQSMNLYTRYAPHDGGSGDGNDDGGSGISLGTILCIM
jgi:hypothetical protein